MDADQHRTHAFLQIALSFLTLYLYEMVRVSFWSEPLLGPVIS